eukprot:m.360617 g.360617  ORF g.360617 m.360617 type:complete len:690 (-) comp19125_c0_seq1:119-2188(-)
MEGNYSVNLADPSQNFASVLYFLQKEWNSFTRDRLKWQREQAELKARITHLEGEKTAASNLQRDLLRRIKMLEGCLLAERAKNSGSEDAAAPVEPLPERKPLAVQLNSVKKSRQILKQYLEEVGMTDNLIHLQAQRLASVPADWPPSVTMSDKPTGGRPSLTPTSSISDSDYKLTEVPSLAGVPALSQSQSLEPLSEQDAARDFDLLDSMLDGADTEETEQQTTQDDEEEEEVITDTAPIESEADQALNVPSAAAEDEPSVVADEVLEEQVAQTFGAKGSKMMSRYGKKSKKKRKSKSKGATATPAIQDVFSQLGQESANLGDLEDFEIEEQEDTSDLHVADTEAATDDAAATLKAKKKWRQSFELRSHMKAVTCVAHDKEDPLLVTGSLDHNVKVWWLPAATQKLNSRVQPTATLRGHKGPVRAVALSTSDSICYSASDDSTIRCWRLPEEDNDPVQAYESMEVACLDEHCGPVIALGLHGNFLASASTDGSCMVWNTDDNTVLARYQLPENVTPLCLHILAHDPSKFAVGCTDGRVLLLALADCKLLQTFDPIVTQEVDTFGDPVEDGKSTLSLPSCICSKADSPIVVVGYVDNHVRVFDAETRELVKDIVAHPSPVTGIDYSPLLNQFVSSGSNRNVRLWNGDTYTCVYDTTIHRNGEEHGVYDVIFSRTCKIISAGAEGHVVIHE